MEIRLSSARLSCPVPSLFITDPHTKSVSIMYTYLQFCNTILTGILLRQLLGTPVQSSDSSFVASPMFVVVVFAIMLPSLSFVIVVVIVNL